MLGEADDKLLNCVSTMDNGEMNSLEELKADIEARKSAIASLPASTDLFVRAKLLRELGDKTLE